jgi:hypothetical protein
MLWVYAGLDVLHTFNVAKDSLPSNTIDLSKVEISNLPKAVQDYCNHNKAGHIFLGYLDPLLMMHPTEETLLRRGFTQCDMCVVVSNPYLLPLSWKNGTAYLKVVEPPNADKTQTLDNGSTAHVHDETEHGRTPSHITDQSDTHKGRKKRSAPKGGKQT